MRRKSDQMSGSMDMADLVGKQPASPAGAGPVLPEFASPAAREGTALAEAPEVMLSRRVQGSKAKRKLQTAFGDEPCLPELVLGAGAEDAGDAGPAGAEDEREKKKVRIEDDSSVDVVPAAPEDKDPPDETGATAGAGPAGPAAKREKKKASITGGSDVKVARLESTFSVYLPGLSSPPALVQDIEEVVDPAVLFAQSDLRLLRTPERVCRLRMHSQSLSPLKRMTLNLEMDLGDLQMYD